MIAPILHDAHYIAEGQQAFIDGITWTETYERYAATDPHRALVAFGWLTARMDKYPQPDQRKGRFIDGKRREKQNDPLIPGLERT